MSQNNRDNRDHIKKKNGNDGLWFYCKSSGATQWHFCPYSSMLVYYSEVLSKYEQQGVWVPEHTWFINKSVILINYTDKDQRAKQTNLSNTFAVSVVLKTAPWGGSRPSVFGKAVLL